MCFLMSVKKGQLRNEYYMTSLEENIAVLVAGDIYAATLHSAVFLRAR